MTNLIGNALKFTPRGGRVTVSVTHLEAQGRVKISVTDTGVGIAAVHTLAVYGQSPCTHSCYFVGEYWQAVSRCRAVLAWHSPAGKGSWLGIIQ